MINNWISRVFGWSSSGSGATQMLNGIGIGELTTPSPSIVDSDELEAELARARRYEHDLSIVVLSARPLTHGTPPQQGLRRSHETKLPQMVALLAAVALREVLRRSDVVCYQPAENRFVLALAESDEDDARRAVGRIRSHFRTRMRLRMRAGIARFPADAFTLDELIGVAASRASRTGTQGAAGNGNGSVRLDAVRDRRLAQTAGTTASRDGRDNE